MAELKSTKVYGDLTVTGDVHANRVYGAVYNDYAEFIEKAEDVDAGQVVVMTENGVTPSSKRGDKKVVGVCSDTYGHILGEDGKEYKTPIGLSGRVDVWVKERVKIGDLLISDKHGFATVKKWYDFKSGIVIGKVLKNKKSKKPERIKMLIMLS